MRFKGTREPRNTSDINDHEYFGSEYEDAGRYEPEDGEDNCYTDEATHYHTMTDHNFHRTGFNGHSSYKEGLSEIGTAKGKKKKKKRGNSSGMENTQLHDGLVCLIYVFFGKDVARAVEADQS